jgi:hypothetical protein
MIVMEKANRILWRVKMQDELDMAASAVEPHKAAYHRRRASDFQRFADQDSPPDTPLDPDFAGYRGNQLPQRRSVAKP